MLQVRRVVAWCWWLFTDTSEPTDPGLRVIVVAAVLGMLVGALLST